MSATDRSDESTAADADRATDAATDADEDRPLVLFVDNFDSFTYNLVEYVSEHADTAVVKNTASLAEIREIDPDAIVISPGPGHPKNDRDVGVTTDVLTELSPEVPTLGVCLGLEAAVYAYGGSVGRAPEPIHGKAFPIDHDDEGVFSGLEQGLRGGRYHSLIATEVPDDFEISATTDHEVPASETSGVSGERNEADARQADRSDGGSSDERSGSGGVTELVMGVRHREHPIECVQFHPESVLTAAGHDVIENFLDEL